MYTIYAAGAGGTETVLFSDTMPDSAFKALSPRLTLTAGAAGSLSLTLPKNNAAHAVVERLTTTMRVERDGETIWMGRVLSEKDDIWHSRTLFCEGALAYLNDTIPMVSLTGAGAYSALDAILTAHNNKVTTESRRITLGEVSVTGSVTVEADGSESLQIINQKLVGTLGGVLRMRYPVSEQTGRPVPTLDWLANYPPSPAGTTPQELVFGTNLLDFVREWDMTDFATYCYVRGAEIEGSEPKAYYASDWQYITPQSGTPPKDLYGRIEKFLDYSDLQSNAACVSAAQTYLETQQFAAMKLDVTALDLRIINPDVKSFDLLETVWVKSPVHGLHSEFVVTAMDIPLDAPESTKYTLGNQNIAYVRRVNTITKVAQANQQAAFEYADTAADGALSSANDHTDKEITDAKEWVENSSELKQEQDRIYMAVTKEVGGGVRAYVQSAAVEMTADQIKQRVSETTTDPQTGEPVTVWTVANLKTDGFHVADQSGVTKITGSMIDVDTIHVNTLYGAVITFVNNQGGHSGSFSLSPVQTIYGSGYELGMSFQQINLGTMPVLMPSPSNVFFVDSGGGYVSLATLLGN